MKKFIFLIAIALTAFLAGEAFENISSSTARFLHQQRKGQPVATIGKSRKVKTAKAGAVEMVQCFVTLNGRDIEAITANGGVVHASFGDDLVVASLPVNKLETVARSMSVKQVKVNHLLEVKSDTARSVTHSEQVWNGLQNGLPKGYDGTGVVLGIIDVGIQYNHTAFKDANGKSRVARVYDPRSTATGGSTITIDGKTLTGKQYTTADQIAALTTDATDTDHGTHTAACAGGSLVEKYSGMAPGVELVLCGLGDELTDTNIAQSSLYIANYAKSVGKPCIISISLGTNTGPHDGSSDICRAYDEIANKYGAVILIAAGNEAEVKGSITNQQITDASKPIAVGLEPTNEFSMDWGSKYYLYCSYDIWNNSSKKLQVAFAVITISSDFKYEVIYTTDKITGTSTGVDVNLSQYFKNSELTVYGGVNSNNGRYNIFIEGDLKQSSYNGKTLKLGILVYGNAGDIVSMWGDSSFSEFDEFKTDNLVFIGGDGSCSIDDEVTGRKTISVGSWASREKYPSNYGSSTGTLSNSYGPLRLGVGNYAYYSSYGTDYNGVNHPFIMAPGHVIVAAYNRYSYPSSYMCSQRVTASDGGEDYWGPESGTSMATPIAAGIVALWKSIKPSLTVDEVKNVMAQTATLDSFMPQVNVRWGHGKIDALAGAKYILNNSGGIRGDVNGDGKVNVTDVTALVNCILGVESRTLSSTDVDGNGTMNVSDVTALVNIILGN